MKGISREDFPKNCLGELSNSSSRRLTHNCFGKITQQFASEDSPIYLPKLGMIFSRTKTFCFENDVFLAFGLGMREGISEGSRSGKGWVAFSSISCRHSSRITYLLECVYVESLHVHLGGE